MTASDRINRIKEMENILDEHTEVIARLRDALSHYAISQARYAKLKDYYMGEEYAEDMSSCDAGRLPQGIKCGVLSEDAVFNLIGDNFEMAVEMLEAATAVIKKH